MGCFNHKGNLSNLPIEYGDKVVCMIGLRRNDGSDTFSLGFSFTPIALPIRGEYNDYGALQNIVETPGVKYLEQFFGMSAEDVVDVAERCESGCENQVEEGYKIIMEKINKILPDYDYSSKKHNYTFGYFLEHESIFDRMVKDGNYDLAAAHHRHDNPDWKSKFLEELGYSQDGKKWVHPEYKTLVEDDYYFYLEDDYNEKNDDYDHSIYPCCYRDFCELIGCEVPEKYKKSWFEMKFEEDMVREKPKYGFYNMKDGCYFINNYNVYGFFHGGEYFNGEMFAMIFHTKDGGHLKEEYKAEFVEFAAFLSAMKTMNMTWGISNYYSQSCVYSYHKNFINTCAEIIDKKIKEED